MHILGQFYWYRIYRYRVKFSNFFVAAETVILGCIWLVIWPKLPKILSILFEILTSDDVQDDTSDMLRVFFWSIDKWLKLSQKIDSFWFILIIFLFKTSYTLWVTSQGFAKWETSLRYKSVLSFISIAYVVVELKIFVKSFSY